MRELSAKSRLVLVRVKIERAKKHLADFEAQAEAFRDAYTHVVGTETDSKTRQSIQYFAKLPISRFEVLAIAGDVLQNLRSALDHLAFQLVEAGECRAIGEKRGKSIGFPICEKPTDYETMKARKIKGARKMAIKAIDTLKPYKGGNTALWRLHYVNNIDKHRHLIGIGESYLFEGEGFDGRYWQKAARPFFRGIFGPEVNQKSKFVIKKPLGKFKIAEGQPLFEFLRETVDYVDRLVTSFEAHLFPRRQRSTLFRRKP